MVFIREYFVVTLALWHYDVCQSSRRTGGKTRVKEESVGLREEDVLDSTKLKNDSGDPR